MKKILSYLFVFSMVMLVAGTLNSTTTATTAVENLSVCHKAGPHWNYMDTPDVSARDGHLGHGDFLYEGGDIEDKDGWCASNVPDESTSIGTITVNKIVEGSDTDPNSFSLFVGHEPVENGVEEEFDLGSYVVSETLVDDFTPTFDGDCDAHGNITLTEEDSDQTCTITNTKVEDHEPDVPIENTCILPTTLEGPKIVSYGVSDDDSLQDILDDESYSVDAVTDETGYQAWVVPAGTASVTFTATFIDAFAGYDNSFGYYTNGDIDTFVPVVYGDSTVVNTTGVTSIGFALKSVDYDAISNYFATELAENPGNDDHAVVFNPSDNTYVIAFEDVTPLGSSDKDFNDLVVEVIIDGCTEVPDEPQNECIPGEELVVNGSFEDPIVTNGANWDIFTSVLGWTFDWMNPSEATPSLELHRGVSGWLSDEGQQHAELDGDFLGPTDSGQGASTDLWQDIPTVLGENYELKFSFSGRPNTAEADNELGVEIDGTDITGSPFIKSNNTGQTDWEQYTHQFTATGATTKIQFQDRGTENALGTFLDDVSVMCLEDDNDPHHDPETITVTVIKYIDEEVDVHASAGNTNSETFPLTSTWTAANLNGGVEASGNFSLGPVGFNNPNPYEATTSPMTAGADYSVVENLGNECTIDNQGQYVLVGYKLGDSEILAAASGTVPTASFTNIQNDKFIIVLNKLCGEVEGETSSSNTTIVTGDTSAGENLLGWLFNRDISTQSPFEFNTDAFSIGIGSLFVEPITNTINGNNDKFIGEFFLLTPMAGVESISYDFQIGTPDNTVEEQFYMNVYANFGASAGTKFYDCRYNVVPTIGSTGAFTTVTFDPTLAYPVTTSGSSPFSPSPCPASPADMDTLSPGSTIRVVALNVGDTSASDTGVSGYLDKVVTVITTGLNTHTETYDFEPPEADLVLEKSVVIDGSSATFTIVVTNGGPDQALEVEVSDLLPAGVSYVSDTPSTGTYDEVTGIWAIGTLAFPGNATLTIEVTIDSEVDILNIATVTSSTDDPNEDNNEDDAIIDVDSDTSDNTPQTSSSSSSGSSSGSRRSSGQVLGATTEALCTWDVNTYMRRRHRNDASQVIILQRDLLNGFMNAGLVVDGVYGPLTEAAVKAFQVLKKDKVLMPWGLTAPTGIFYKTTLVEAKNTICPEVILPIPTDLIPWSRNLSQVPGKI